MKYRLFEQAADEARAGIEELNAEIDRLEARRELFQILEALVRQVMTVLPMDAEAIPAEEAPGTPLETAVVREPSCANNRPEGGPEPLTRETGSGVRATAEEPFAEQPSSAENLLKGESYSAEMEEVLAGSATTANPSAAATRCDADALSIADDESLETDESQSDLPASTTAEIFFADDISRADSLPQSAPESNQEEELPAEPAADIAAEERSPEEPAADYASLSDYLSREEPFSLRKQGWPAPSSTDEGEIRKKLL